MNFCTICSNYYFIKIDENELIHYCRNCGHQDNTISNVCITKISKQIVKNPKNFVNEYTKYDPTNPHIDYILCPNEECVCNKDATVKPDIVTVRYDSINMKYVYVCALCDAVFTNE